MDPLPVRISRMFKTGSGAAQPFPVEELLKSINLIVGLDQILEMLSAQLKEIGGVETSYLALFEPITNRYVGMKARGKDEALLPELVFSPSDRLMKWLSINQSPLDLLRQTDVVRFLSSSERALLDRLGVALIIPFIAVNRLTGAAFLSRSSHGEAVEEDLIERLMLVANHTALAIEHALMYQFQEDKLKKLFHADKLATVGELAAGAAHEIRNPLTSIRSTVQYLKKDLPGDKQSLVEGIIEEVDRIDGIIKGLLSLSKSSQLQISEVDIADLIRQSLVLLDPELRTRGITAHEDTRLAARYIAGDPAQLKQLFLNILLNSVQAMPEGGTLAVSIQEEHASVLVTIKDSGAGIPADDLPKVFDPFFTSKDNGTGLGLSISYGIVSKHGGEIRIQSSTTQPGRGTSVLVRLPRRIDRGGKDQ